jgi:hypothetical protein
MKPHESKIRDKTRVKREKTKGDKKPNQKKEKR